MNVGGNSNVGYKKDRRLNTNGGRNENRGRKEN